MTLLNVLVKPKSCPMQPKRIYPEYALILKYDVQNTTLEGDYRYVVQDFIPMLRRREVYAQNLWSIVYGDYPQRHLEFVVEQLATLRGLLDDPEWVRMEQRLQEYAANYSRRIVPYRGVFKL